MNAHPVCMPNKPGPQAARNEIRLVDLDCKQTGLASYAGLFVWR